MAQLTWKNVDAPNFASSVQALQGAGEAITRGFQASRQAIEGYEKDQTQIESAKLMAATMGIKDPAQLQSIIAGFHPGYLAPDALKFAAGRPQDLATLAGTQASTAQTQAQTTGINLTNQLNTGLNPLKIEAQKLANIGTGLVNTGQGITNDKSTEDLRQTVFNNANVRNEYAAKPAWDQESASISTMMASGDPVARAAGLARLATPEVIAKASAAGIKDPAAYVQNAAKSAELGVKIRTDTLALNEAERTLYHRNLMEEGFQKLTSTFATPTAALQAIQSDQTYPPDVRQALIERIQKNPNNWGNTVANETEVLTTAVRPRTAANPLAPTAAQPANYTYLRKFADDAQMRDPDNGINKLAPVFAGKIATMVQDMPDDIRAGFKIASGWRSDEHQAGLTPKYGIKAGAGLSRHNGENGYAVDISEKDGGKVLAWIRANGPKYGLELPHADDPNHLQEIGARGGNGHASSGSSAARLLAAASNPVAPVNWGSSPAGKINLGPVATPAPQGTVETRSADPDIDFMLPIKSAKDVSAALHAGADTSQIDSGWGSMAPMVAELATRPHLKQSSSEVAQRVHKELGSEIDTSFFRSKNLTAPIIEASINNAVATHGISPDIAGALVKGAIVTTKNFGFLAPDGRQVDPDIIAKHVKEFIDVDGPVKGLKTKHLNLFRQKESIQKTAADGIALLESAKQEYMATELAYRRGMNVDREGPRKKFLDLQKFLRNKNGEDNPNRTANTRSLTGK